MANETSTPAVPDVPDAATTQDEHQQRVVFVGVRSAGAGEWWAVFMQLTDDERADPHTVPVNVPRERWLAYGVDMMGKLRDCRPGAIYKATIDEKKSIRYDRKSWPESFVPAERRLQWAALHSANDRARKAADALQKEAKRNVIAEQLEPLRTAYRALNGNARVQLLAEIVDYVTRK